MANYEFLQYYSYQSQFKRNTYYLLTNYIVIISKNKKKFY